MKRNVMFNFFSAPVRIEQRSLPYLASETMPLDATLLVVVLGFLCTCMKLDNRGSAGIACSHFIIYTKLGDGFISYLKYTKVNQIGA